jgi:hypothetical protein
LIVTITDPFDPSNYKLIGGMKVEDENKNKSNQQQNGTPVNKLPEPGDTLSYNLDLKKAPVKANPTPNLDAAARRRSRKVTNGPAALSMPDFKKMLDPDNRYAKDVYDSEFLNNPVFETRYKNKQKVLPATTKDVVSSLRRFEEHHRKNSELIDLEFISETKNEDNFIDLSEIEDDLKK